MPPTPTELRVFNARNVLKKLMPEKVVLEDGKKITKGDSLYYNTLGLEFGVQSMKELSEDQIKSFAATLEGMVRLIEETKEEKVS